MRKFLLTYIIAISFTLIYLEQISSILIKLGNKINILATSFISGFLLIFALIIVVYIYLISKHYIHNKKVNFLVLYIGSTYIIYRFIFTKHIEFLYFEGFPPFTDIIIIISFFHILNLIIKGKKENINSNYFLEDTLFSNEIIDNELILNKLIEATSDMKTEIAFNIGVNAVWGYGKSTFLERFEIEYKKKNNTAIVFWYRIWKNKTSAGIIENFFEELKLQLNPHSGEISNSIDNYVKAVLDLSPSEIKKFLTTGLDLFNEHNSLEKHYKVINSTIKKVDRQIIVLLDDLDRLDKNEILNSLKLIRTISDFNNVIFIAGYDREYIIKTINLPKDNYLDKIFNVELNLLPFKEDKLVYQLFELVDKEFPDKENTITKETDINSFNYAFKNLFKKRGENNGDNLSLIFPSSNINIKQNENFKELSYLDFLPTYRDVKRFINEFKFYSSFLDNHVNINSYDYILYRLLVYKYRGLESIIFNKIETILSKRVLNILERKITKHPIANNGDLYVFDEEAEKKVLDEIKSYNKVDKAIIIATLGILFSPKNYEYYEVNQNSIAKIDYINIYLRNNIIEGKVKISEFIKALDENSLFELSITFTEYENQLQYSLKKELIIFIKKSELKTKEQVKDVLKAINQIGGQYLFQYDTGFDFLNKTFEKFYNNISEFQTTIIEIITQNNEIGYLDDLLSEYNLRLERSKFKSRNNPSFVDNDIKVDFLDNTFIKKILLQKLEILINKEISTETIISVYLLFTERKVLADKIMISFESNKLLRNDIEKRKALYFNSDLFNFERTSNDLDLQGFQPNFFLSSIFSNENTVKKFLDDDNNQEKYDTIYKEGWHNLNDFIKGLNSKELDLDNKKSKFHKVLMQAFIDNDCKPLAKEKYEEILNKHHE
jgi:hypothetical protein